MNFYDARVILSRHEAGLPVGSAALEQAHAALAGERSARGQTRAFPPLRKPSFLEHAIPPMDELCVCGLRYGAHRIGDYACPNQLWRPGNGQPQWKTAKFQREAARAMAAQQPGV